MIEAEVRSWTDETAAGPVIRARLFDRGTGLELSTEAVLAAFARLDITGVCVKLRTEFLHLSPGWPSLAVITRIDGERVTVQNDRGQGVQCSREVFRERYELD